MLTRREFGTLTLGGLALPIFGGLINSKVAGVRLGAQTYSFRDLPRPPEGDMVDTLIKAMADCGLGECEVWAPQIEPPGPPGGARGTAPTADATSRREELRKWRLETPLGHFREIGKKFKTAGITFYAYNYSFNSSFTDQEIDRGFDIAKALGARIITASTTLDVAKRVVPFAEKHKMVVAMHGHSNTKDPNEFSSPESFAAAMAMSKLFKVNLDIGHFTAAGYDPIAYLREHHDHITNLHLKDRKKDQGDNTPWGEGDTKIKEVLQLLKRERWPIPAYVEYEYKAAGSPIEEVKKCYAYAKAALA